MRLAALRKDQATFVDRNSTVSSEADSAIFGRRLIQFVLKKVIWTFPKDLGEESVLALSQSGLFLWWTLHLLLVFSFGVNVRVFDRKSRATNPLKSFSPVWEFDFLNDT
jgi:hypothetical protein